VAEGAELGRVLGDRSYTRAETMVAENGT